jgi:hypothetical protein
MPRFSFHVRQGEFWNACPETACESNAEAREEAMAICADLSRDIFAYIQPCIGTPIWLCD